MIHAGFFSEGKKYRVIVAGHAGYGPPGQDIVCCAASTLVGTCVAYLLNSSEFKCKVISMRQGYAEFLCSECSKEFLRMTCMGFLQLSEQYPKYVTLKEDIWKSNLTRPAEEGRDAAAPSRNSGDKQGVHIYGRKHLFGRLKGFIRGSNRGRNKRRGKP